MARWCASILVFLASTFLAAILPWPDLGCHGVEQLAWSSDSGEVNYHLTPVWGTLYFFAMAVLSRLEARGKLKRFGEGMMRQQKE